jgi:hypothetical protein
VSHVPWINSPDKATALPIRISNRSIPENPHMRK